MAYQYDIPFHVDLSDRVALVTGGNGGIGGHGTKTGDTTPLGLAILLMLAAACTATLVLGLRREQAK